MPYDASSRAMSIVPDASNEDPPASPALDLFIPTDASYSPIVRRAVLDAIYSNNRHVSEERNPAFPIYPKTILFLPLVQRYLRDSSLTRQIVGAS